MRLVACYVVAASCGCCCVVVAGALSAVCLFPVCLLLCACLLCCGLARSVFAAVLLVCCVDAVWILCACCVLVVCSLCARCVLVAVCLLVTECLMCTRYERAIPLMKGIGSCNVFYFVFFSFSLAGTWYVFFFLIPFFFLVLSVLRRFRSARFLRSFLVSL